jgi:hypothetical protein
MGNPTMRRTISLTAVMSLVTTIIACSHPQVRDASQVDVEEHTELLAGICGDAACSSCPAFLGAQGEDAQGEGSLSFARVLYGSFSYSTADEALVEVSGCGDGHSVVALERRDGQWHRFGWQKDVSLGECEQIERENGATGVVCHTPHQAHSDHLNDLKMLGVRDGTLKKRQITHSFGPSACDEPLGSGYSEIYEWQLTPDKSAAEYTHRKYCFRTKPDQSVCEARDAGIEPLHRMHPQQRADLSWSNLNNHTIGDFCDRTNLRSVADATGTKLERCVALGGQQDHTGNYIARWKIRLDGGVYQNSPHLKETATDDARVTDCFKKVLSEMQFEKPEGGICIINFSFFFFEGNYWKNACEWFDPPPVEWLEQQNQ